MGTIKLTTEYLIQVTLHLLFQQTSSNAQEVHGEITFVGNYSDKQNDRFQDSRRRIIHCGLKVLTIDPPSVSHRNRSAPKVTLIMMKLDKAQNSSAETNINHNLSFLDVYIDQLYLAWNSSSNLQNDQSCREGSMFNFSLTLIYGILHRNFQSPFPSNDQCLNFKTGQFYRLKTL